MDLIIDISTFSLSIFAIGITIFTVVYSFITNKKEYINNVADILSRGDACPETKAKYIIAEKYITRQRKSNLIILCFTALSFILYTLSQFYLHIYQGPVFRIIIISLAIILLIGLFLALIVFFNSYFKYVK